MHKFRDESLSIDERVEILLNELTVDEKLGLINYRNEGVPRLGINPYVWWNEALHGLARSGSSTVFPQAIAMAATFSPELVEKMGEVIAAEGNARHADSVRHGDYGAYKGLTYWSPNVNIFRDPRWGRGHETYGECPWLTGELGAAYVRGVQGDDPENLKAVATPKHFAVHSGPEKNRLEFDAVIGEKDLRETYLPAFKKCIEAGAQSVMSAYNAVNGTPASTNSYLLKEILRNEWQFDGAVVTDAGAGIALVNDHKRYADYPEAIAQELKNGADVITDNAVGAREAFERGLIGESDLDNALRNHLRVKFRLGLFNADRPAPSCNVIECKEHRALALEASRKSIVLLKNKNNILPLNPDKIRSLAVIGPNADSKEVLLGNYHGTPTRYVTLLNGILNAVDDKCQVIYARGCEHTALRTEFCAEDYDRIGEALGAAERADISILFVGLTPLIEGEAGDAFNSEYAGDKPDLELPGLQKHLIEKIASLGKPVILAVVSGSALVIPEQMADGVIQVFYPGAEGGTAFADILFGKVNPSGKLPITFYRSTDDLPPFEDYSMKNRTYRFFKDEVLHPFGFGLSYTTFQYSNLRMEDLTATVDLKNTGNMPGEEVVQVYVSNQTPEAPLKQLAAVQRIFLQPGETKAVKLQLNRNSFLQTSPDGKQSIGQGNWKITVGGIELESIITFP